MRHLSDEQIQKILKLLARGEISVAAIAQRFGVSMKTIRELRQEAKIPSPPQHLFYG
jgi:DeoR/GlpR family transcriptional regulator of sugar metabolism